MVVCRGLSEYIRCCVAVSGGASGAAGTAEGWRFIRSGASVWLATATEDTQNVVTQQSEVDARARHTR